MSAPVFVSNTLLNPNLFNAVTIFPVTFVPTSIWNSSPSATLTAGAVCTTTNVSGSFNFTHTSFIVSFSWRAPVGQLWIHCPQNVQLTSFKLWSPTVDIQDSKPLFMQSIAPIPWTFLQADMHLLQSIHFSKSLTIEGDKSSILCLVFSPSNSTLSTLNFVANFCNSQFPERVHVKQSFEWFEIIKSNITCLASNTFGVCVCTTIPSSTVCMQDVAKPLLPSTSTTQILQSPTSFISFKKQSVGMSIPASFAACNIVVPFFTFTSCPSIFSFTNSFSTIFFSFQIRIWKINFLSL